MTQQKKLNLFIRISLFFIVVYRKIYLFKPHACRFYPTCSQYAYDVIVKKGNIGFFIALLRILRCNPFSKGGYDPVK